MIPPERRGRMQRLQREYDFILTKDATASFSATLFANANIFLSIFNVDTNTILSSFTDPLTHRVNYALHVIDVGGPGISYYDGNVTFTASTVPIPPALMMFVTALGGLSFLGYRRRSTLAD